MAYTAVMIRDNSEALWDFLIEIDGNEIPIENGVENSDIVYHIEKWAKDRSLCPVHFDICRDKDGIPILVAIPLVANN